MNANEIKALSRAELEKRLQKLAQTPPPSKLAPGAKGHSSTVSEAMNVRNTSAPLAKRRRSASLMVCCLATVVGCNTAEGNTNEIKALSRAELEKRLQKLAQTPPPSNLSPGAMCYIGASRPSTEASYICLSCGEKTLYKDAAAKNLEEIDEARRQIKALQATVGSGLSLDESQFCRKCSPDIKQPKLVLRIQYDDGQKWAVSGITPEDLLLLEEFFADKLTHDKGMAIGRPMEGEKPLKDHIVRLQELLGVKAQ